MRPHGPSSGWSPNVWPTVVPLERFTGPSHHAPSADTLWSGVAIRIQSVAEPFESGDPEAAREAVQAIVLAEAMGLLGDEAVERLDLATLRRVTRAASEAGIATVSTAALAGRGLGPSELRSSLRRLR